MRYFFIYIFLILGHQISFASIIIQNGLSHQYKVSAGTVYTGTIIIQNTSDKAQNVKLYFEDITYNGNGETVYSALNENPRSNAKWIKLETNLLALGGKEVKSVFYTISVPKDSLQAGSYWTSIMVEPIDDYKPDGKKGGFTITSVVRYSIQIITDIHSDDIKTELEFKKLNMSSIDGKRTLEVAIQNTGNLYCRATATVELFDKQTAKKIGRFSSIPAGLYPLGNYKIFNIDLSTVPKGSYKAALIATDQENNAFAIDIDLEVKDE
jgi:hypothetical protein